MAALTPPTSFLPPLKRLDTHSLDQIATAIARLDQLYFPRKLSLPATPKARHHLLHDASVPDSGYASAEEDDEDDEDEDALELLRADPFERTHAVRWLTGLTARADAFLYPATPLPPSEESARSSALDAAAALLAAFVRADLEPPDEPGLARAFAFAAPGAPVRVQLTDEPLRAGDHTSVGLQSWASSIIFAERMCAAPAAFGLAPRARVLELGAGTGLLSIAAAHLFARHAGTDGTGAIVATDFHPAVLANLSRNVAANFPAAPESAVAVCALDWAAPDWAAPLLAAPFDIALAADVVYEPAHAGWIRGVVARALAPGGVFWMILAHRGSGRHAGLVEAVGDVFPACAGVKPEGEPILAVLEQTDIGRVQGCGRADEDMYRLYKIGWVHA